MSKASCFLRHFWNTTLIAVIFLTALVAVSPVRAATVVSANALPSTLEAGQSANHRVFFTTSHAWDQGDTLSLYFTVDPGFTGVGIIEDDLDLLIDGVQQTTAPDCSGTEDFSIVPISSSFQFTPCVGDISDIPQASEIEILIGTNATFSGIGTEQLVNPVEPGTYYIWVSWETDGVTENGAIAVPISDQSDIAVSAEVETGASGGGGGPGPLPTCGDTVPPTLSNIIVSGVTETSVTVTWSTSEAASSFIDYGIFDVSEGIASDSALVVDHAIVLSGLTAGKTYQARVRSLDACSNEGFSNAFTFTPADTTAPVISNVQVVDITKTSARITWDTDESANSRVDIGQTVSYGAFQASTPFVTSHSVLLTSLAEGVTYHFFVTSVDQSGNSAVSSDAVFTLPSDLPPANVTLTVTAGNGENALSWVNPSDTDFAGVRILRCLKEYPSGPRDVSCVVVFDALGVSQVDTGLVNDTTYFYGAYAYDLAGQFASGALGFAIPMAPEEEVPPYDEEDPGGQTLFCGDGVCQDTESAASCPADCHSVKDEEMPEEPISPPDIEIPPTTIEVEELVPATDVLFFVAAGTISLEPTLSKEVVMLGNRPLHVVLLDQRITKPVSRVELIFGSNRYALTFVSGEGYAADIMSPVAPDTMSLAVVIYYADETLQSLAFTATLRSDGYSFEDVSGQQNVVGDVTATLFTLGAAWDAAPYGQFNPVLTEHDGAFAWYVPNGTYEVRVSHAGYEGASSGTLLVSDHLVRPTIRIVLTEALPSVLDTPTPSEPALESGSGSGSGSISSSGSAAILAALPSIQEVSDFLASPLAQEAAQAATPVVVTSVAVGTVSLAFTPGLLPFFQYLFTSPFLFFARRRRKGFGVVYNAISKLPIDLSTVRLFRLPDVIPPGVPLPAGRLVQSRVTDKGGRYFFLVEPGLYRLTAQKTGFTFPSEMLLRVKDDGTYLDVYHEEAVTVTEKDAVIAANIPLDPSQADAFHAPKTLLRMRRFRQFQGVLALSGVIVAIVVAIVRPLPLTIGIATVQVLLFLFTKRLTAPTKPKSWGIVYDRSTKRPLANVVVRIFEPTYNKLLETTLTDSRGRYTVLLGPNTYYSVYERTGYDPIEVRPIDYRNNKEPKEFAVKVDLPPSVPPKAPL